jgi:hypothetical protein
LAVTFTCTNSRRPCSMNTSTYSVLKVSVGTVNRSAAPEMVRVVGQEGPPGLARRTPRSTPAGASDRAVADHDARLEQLAPDSLRAPEPVFARHGGDQPLDFWAEVWAATSGTRRPTPEQAPALPMPAHDCLWRDYRPMFAPAEWDGSARPVDGARASSQPRDRRVGVPGPGRS